MNIACPINKNMTAVGNTIIAVSGVNVSVTNKLTNASRPPIMLRKTALFLSFQKNDPIITGPTIVVKLNNPNKINKMSDTNIATPMDSRASIMIDIRIVFEDFLSDNFFFHRKSLAMLDDK